MTYDIYLIIFTFIIFIVGFITPLLILIVLTPYLYKNWKIPKIRDGVPTKWGWVVRHTENFYLGKNTDIGAFTYIQAKNGVHIGENVQIGSHCSIYSENTIEKTSCRISIRPNSCIGAGTVIIPRKGKKHLEIGSNTIVGAMSLIKDDIPDNSIYAGIPAKPIEKDD